MSAGPHARYEELVVGHALSALEPEDEQALLRHLPTCAACERDLAVHRETLGHLAHVVDQSEPPPAQLWDAIRSQVVAQSGAGAFPEPREEPVAPVSLVEPVAGVPVVADLASARARRERRRRPAAWAAVAAAVAVVAAVSVVGVTRSGDNGGAGSSQLASAVAQVLETAPGQTVPLSGRDGRAVGVAVVQGAKVSLIVDGLAPNDRTTSTYVLWGQSGAEKARAMGTFDVEGTLDVERDLTPMAPGDAVPSLFIITREDGRVAPEVAAGAAVATGRTL